MVTTLLTSSYSRPVHTILLTLLVVSCDRGPDATAPMLPIDSAGVRIVESDPTSSDATCSITEEPTLVIGDDETDERQWFSYVRGAGRLSDGSIVAADRATAEVRIYDETGRHLRSMGRKGEGPGEFDDPFQLWVVVGDTLWVGDSMAPWRYNVFTAQGEFVRQVNLTPVFPNSSVQGGVLDNGYSVNSMTKHARRRDFTNPDTLLVQIHDPEGTLARMPDRSSGSVKEVPDFGLFPLFQSFAGVDAAGSTIVLAHGSDTEVRVLDDVFNLRTIIRWFEPDREVTGAYVRAWREDYTRSRNQFASVRWSRFDDARVSSNRPVADLFPSISTVMIGKDGRIPRRAESRTRWPTFVPQTNRCGGSTTSIRSGCFSFNGPNVTYRSTGDPISKSVTTRVVKGFHSPYRSTSVSMSHTRSIGASISKASELIR